MNILRIISFVVILSLLLGIIPQRMGAAECSPGGKTGTAAADPAAHGHHDHDAGGGHHHAPAQPHDHSGHSHDAGHARNDHKPAVAPATQDLSLPDYLVQERGDRTFPTEAASFEESCCTNAPMPAPSVNVPTLPSNIRFVQALVGVIVRDFLASPGAIGLARHSVYKIESSPPYLAAAARDTYLSISVLLI